MEIQRVCAVYFSPSGTTRKTVMTAAEELAKLLGVPLQEVPFTLPGSRERDYYFAETDLVVMGSPTYAGKLPNKILPDFRSRLHGKNTPVLALVTYGGRGYENSLAELVSVLGETGFNPIAAGAFVCQHAFTDALSYGRPGWSDQFELKMFVKKVADKVKCLTGVPGQLQVSGDASAPYYVPKGVDGEPVNFLKAKPKTKLDRCNNCGACVRACPMAAIDPKQVSHVPGTCIKCHACVHRCTKRAKYFDDPAFLSHVAMLERDHAESAENETFI